jgi:26S proteasome regulatory subunit N10
MSKLHLVQPNGNVNLVTGIRIAQLVLKHRQGKNHKMRIVIFIGSPVVSDEAELVKLAKRLKKEKVNVDIVSFGDHQTNNDLLTNFINALNGKDGSGSHLVSVPRGSQLQDALISSPIIQGEDGLGGAGLGGAGFEFGVDPNEDPELALVFIETLINRENIPTFRLIPGPPSFHGGTASATRRRTTTCPSHISC